MIVLDTHIWIWRAANSAKLSRSMRNKLNKADALGVPAISCWEVAMLESKGRLALAQPARVWIELALAIPGISLLPLDPEIAWLAMNLPGDFHGDPADQQIIRWGQVRLV